MRTMELKKVDGVLQRTKSGKLIVVTTDTDENEGISSISEQGVDRSGILQRQIQLQAAQDEAIMRLRKVSEEMATLDQLAAEIREAEASN
jgi:hypothetical protein